MGELRHADGLERLGDVDLRLLRPRRIRTRRARTGLLRDDGPEQFSQLIPCRGPHPRERRVALRQRQLHPGTLAHLAVSDLATVPAVQRQQQHSEHAGRGQGEYSPGDERGVALQRGLRHVRPRVDRARAGLGRGAGGRQVVPADRRVRHYQCLGLALHRLRDEARVGQCVVDALVALTPAHVQQRTGEPVARARGHREVGGLAVGGAGERQRGQVRGVQLRREHAARAHARQVQPVRESRVR